MSNRTFSVASADAKTQIQHVVEQMIYSTKACPVSFFHPKDFILFWSIDQKHWAEICFTCLSSFSIADITISPRHTIGAESSTRKPMDMLRDGDSSWKVSTQTGPQKNSSWIMTK